MALTVDLLVLYVPKILILEGVLQACRKVIITRILAFANRKGKCLQKGCEYVFMKNLKKT